VTHALMGELVPECVMAFLKDVAILARRDSILRSEDLDNLRRLKLPIHFISGSENRMFVPESTRKTYDLLCDVNGPERYTRTVHDGFGHLDCYFGKGAPELIWPDIARALDAEMRSALQDR
jgi:cholesterol oxidase